MQTRFGSGGLLSPWSGQGKTVSNNLATRAAVPGSSTTTATTPALAPIIGQVALPPCNWIKHTFRRQ
ncbi:hypothetical protein MKX01_033444 [Papaver californicum]|nr:hypothetical protein MKX01_033444 [Papaver californicum]